MDLTEQQITDAFNILKAQTEAEIIHWIKTAYISAEIAVQSYPKNKTILSAAYQISPQVMRYADQSLINELGRAGVIKQDDVLNVFSMQQPSPNDLAEKAQRFEEAIAKKAWDEAKKLITGFWFEFPEHMNKQTIVQNIVKNLNADTSWDVLYEFQKQDQKNSEYMYGPLQKADETRDLENLARAMMQSADFEILVREDEEFIIFEPLTLSESRKKEEFNWTKIIKNANFQDIVLNENDFKLYKNYWKRYPKKPYSTLSKKRQQEYSFLSFAEQQAVFVYSGGSYKEINQLMRDKPAIFGKKHQDLRFQLIHAVMCASALTKFSDLPLPPEHCSKRGLAFSSNILEKFICAAANQDVVKLEGFISSVYSLSNVNFQTYVRLPIQLNLFNLKGLYIDPISCYSGEQEYLILPTEVRFFKYRQNKNPYDHGQSHYFDVELVRPLEDNFIPIVWASQHPLLKDVEIKCWLSLIEAGKIDPHAAAFQFSNNEEIILAAYGRNSQILGNISAPQALELAEKKLVSWHDVYSIFSQHPHVIKRNLDKQQNEVGSSLSKTCI